MSIVPTSYHCPTREHTHSRSVNTFQECTCIPDRQGYEVGTMPGLIYLFSQERMHALNATNRPFIVWPL
jgi:hypothetical protein